jgi:hypothetical protein
MSDPTRWRDKGSSAPDLNLTSSGKVTPRSDELNKAYDYAEGVVKGTIKLTDTGLMDDFINPLREASILHGPDVALDPGRANWQLDANQKYYRPTG